VVGRSSTFDMFSFLGLLFAKNPDYMTWIRKTSKIQFKHFLFMQLWFRIYWCWEKDDWEIFWDATTTGKSVIK